MYKSGICDTKPEISLKRSSLDSRAKLTLEVAMPTPRPAPFRPRLPCSYLAKSRPQHCWLPTCDVMSARQWSYPVSALSGVHLPGKNTGADDVTSRQPGCGRDLAS